jgi:hypothetical protein
MSKYWMSGVEYGKESANFSAGQDSEADAMARMWEDVAYLREQGATIREAHIQWFCAGCDGHGETWVPIRGKRNMGKRVPCPQCLGMSAKGERVYYIRDGQEVA